MAVATVNHQIPDALVAQAAGYGIDLTTLIKWVELYGPQVIKILEEIFALFSGPTKAAAAGAVNWAAILAWLGTHASDFAFAFSILKLVLPFLGIVIP